MTKMMKMMNGKMDFNALYEKQIGFQAKVTGYKAPADDYKWFAYHMCAMVEELGEALKADKRWKTHRNVRFEKHEKLDELADIFITAMNLSMFSGFSSEEIYHAIAGKIDKNSEKLNYERELGNAGSSR